MYCYQLVIEYNGKKKSLQDWAQELGIKPRTLYARIVEKKLTIETAFMPVKIKYRNKTK